MSKLEQSIKEGIKEPEIFKDNEAKGVFVKYDVEYTDTYMNYEYTSKNGWRLENYELAPDGKTLSNVRLISTGIPARMYYYYNDTTNNYSKWITDSTKLEEFKNNILGTDYTDYTGIGTHYSLQASAGFYYNLGQMTFEQGTTYDKKNQGYYTKIKNGNTTYTNGEKTGDNLFKARNDASIRMLTLPEFNKAMQESDIDKCDYEFTDIIGIYRLDTISTATSLKNNKYNNDGYYWLASPYPINKDDLGHVCGIGYAGYVSAMYGGTFGIRPIISLTSKIQLIKKTDDTGFVYYEMVNVN